MLLLFSLHLFLIFILSTSNSPTFSSKSKTKRLIQAVSASSANTNQEQKHALSFRSLIQVHRICFFSTNSNPNTCTINKEPAHTQRGTENYIIKNLQKEHNNITAQKQTNSQEKNKNHNQSTIFTELTQGTRKHEREEGAESRIKRLFSFSRLRCSLFRFRLKPNFFWNFECGNGIRRVRYIGKEQKI